MSMSYTHFGAEPAGGRARGTEKTTSVNRLPFWLARGSKPKPLTFLQKTESNEIALPRCVVWRTELSLAHWSSFRLLSPRVWLISFRKIPKIHFSIECNERRWGNRMQTLADADIAFHGQQIGRCRIHAQKIDRKSEQEWKRKTVNTKQLFRNANMVRDREFA